MATHVGLIAGGAILAIVGLGLGDADTMSAAFILIVCGILVCHLRMLHRSRKLRK